MMFKHRIKTIAISAAALLSTLMVAAPASAASYYYQPHCTRTYSNNLMTYKCWYELRTVSNTSPTAPVPAAKPAPTTSTSPASGLTAEEQQMLNLVNAERAKAGLPALKADLQLTKLARMKSQDMINHNYFSHQSPTYGSPFDMMKNYGVSYRTAGENIAGNQSVQAAHTALMNSSGHRANIMNAQFTSVGIGIVHGGQYGIMFTQQFVGR